MKNTPVVMDTFALRRQAEAARAEMMQELFTQFKAYLSELFGRSASGTKAA